jgi:hypothetical protein
VEASATFASFNPPVGGTAASPLAIDAAESSVESLASAELSARRLVATAGAESSGALLGTSTTRSATARKITPAGP